MQGQLSPWAKALHGFEDWEDDRKRHVATQLLQAAGQAMQNPQIVPRPADDEIQLRGVHAGYPARVVIDGFWHIAVDVKAKNRQEHTLTVFFDPESAPSPGDADPWDDGDDVRVFLARCVYVEASAGDIDQTLAIIQRLPLELRQHLCQLMQSNHLAVVSLTGDGASTSFRNDLGAMWDPMTQLAQALWLVAYGASVYAALPPPADRGSLAGHSRPSQGGYAGAAAPLHPKCRYCGTIFLLGASSACPNCGAAYAGS